MMLFYEWQFFDKSSSSPDQFLHQSQSNLSERATSRQENFHHDKDHNSFYFSSQDS